MEKPIENMKNMAYARIVEKREKKHIASQSANANQYYKMRKEVDQDLIEDLKGKVASKEY